MTEVVEIIQGSEKWHAARRGKLTASRLADALAKTKSGWGASRANLMADLVAERLTGTSAVGFTNEAMRWGVDQEPNARIAYEFLIDIEVTQVGFVDHPKISMSGASPDGLVLDSGLVEIKCPNTATHIETLLGQTIPAKYCTQMLWQMACTGREWCDFVSYDPRMPADMQLFVKRLHRDGVRIVEMEKEAIAFLEEVDAKLAALIQRFRSAT
jgi:putative phage-type endonuclease